MAWMRHGGVLQTTNTAVVRGVLVNQEGGRLYVAVPWLDETSVYWLNPAYGDPAYRRLPPAEREAIDRVHTRLIFSR